MTESGHDTAAKGVTYEGAMELVWSRREASSETANAQEYDRNERLLRALLLFHEHHREAVSEEVGERVGDLTRIEAKLDLLFDLFCQQWVDKPRNGEFCPVQLWLSGVSWCTASDTPPQVGESLWLSLYLDPGIPQPLKLPVTVSGLRRDDSQWWVDSGFEALDESLDDLLSRFIFRQHRRRVALLKAREHAQDAI